MDTRFLPVPLDVKRSAKVILHPTASLEQVTHGQATDGIDLSDFVGRFSQGQFEVTITLAWRRELFGEDQPKPHQILEIQLEQDGVFVPNTWVGIIDTISGYDISRGQRSMQLIARSRDQQGEWRITRRSTLLYPQMTDLTAIARDIAKTVGLVDEDILIPQGSFFTSHSNTQMADMTAWEMLEQIFIPQGWIPFTDGLGRLRHADKDIQFRPADIVLTDERVVRARGSRRRATTTRVRVLWRDPLLSKHMQQARKLADVVMTIGWFLPKLTKEVYFSDDETQRAQDTYFMTKQSVNNLFPFCNEEWVPNINFRKGELIQTNYLWAPLIATLIASWYAAHSTPDGTTTPGGPTVPIGRKLEATFQLAFTLLLMNLGTGIYEIWGYPFEYAHARNTTEAYNSAMPSWADHPKEVECDFIADQQHSETVATRELIWETRASSKWTITIVDDPRIEFGDVLQLPDGTKFYVEDTQRDLSRGADANLDVTGFLI